MLCKQEERISEGKLSVFHDKLACVKKYFQKVCGLFRSWRLFDLKIPFYDIRKVELLGGETVQYTSNRDVIHQYTACFGFAIKDYKC